MAKLKLLEQYRDRDGLEWDDAKLQLIDLQYADIRPEKGLYHRLVGMGRIERLLDDAAVEAAMHDPPEDTRAYFRGRCLEKYADHVAAASWDSVIFDLPGRESLQRVPDHRPAARQPRRTSATCSTAATPPRQLFAAAHASQPRLSWTRVEAWHRSRSSRGSPRRPRRPPRSRPRATSPSARSARRRLDAILDEIDDVLETNAEDFVKSFIQKGGQ